MSFGASKHLSGTDGAQRIVGIAADAGLSRYSLIVVTVCFLTGIVEGFDYAAAAFAVPLIGEEWDASHAALGWVFTTAALGAILGNIFLAPLGDRWGRRPAVILNLLLTGLATLAGGLTTSVEGLALSRLVCGIGVGGLYPNLIAIGLEHLPPRHRSMGAVIIACSMPVGLTISGFISGALGAQYGWPIIFYFSGGLSLLIVLLSIVALPESPQYLLRFPQHRQRGRELMERAFPGVDLEEAIAAVQDPASSEQGERIVKKYAVLVSPAYRTTTLLIWSIFFLTMVMNYFFSGWLPAALAKEGMDLEAATRALSVFTIGGLIGSLVTSAAQNRTNPAAALSTCYVIAIAGLLVLGQIPLDDGPLLLATMFFVGWGIFGGQFALIVMTGSYYSTQVRSTGLGAATAIGRSGGMIISLVGGILLTANVATSSIFAALAGPGLLALFAVLGLWKLSHRPAEAEGNRAYQPAE
jgi:AAHS family 4-hydroxybenzoate transporter-like MFS transporter